MSGSSEDLQQLDDQALMDQFQEGAAAAFDLLVERYQDPLMNFIYRFVGSRAEAEDLLQETFLRVYRNRHSYKPKATFKTWLYTIAGNLGRSRYTKKKRRGKEPLTPVNREGQEYQRPIPSEEEGPEEATGRSVREDLLHETLQQVDEPFRETVVLRDIQQLTYEEIATITGAPLGTVKSRIHRGRTQLRRELEAAGYSGFSAEEEER